MCKVLCEDWLEERSVDDLGTIGLWERQPKDKNKLEGVVEWEPVNGADCTLKYGQEGIYNPVRQPLCIISASGGEQGIKRVISWDDKADSVDKKFSGYVEENQEEI